MLGVLLGEKEAIPVGGKLVSVYADRIIIMMTRISVVLTLSSRLSHSVIASTSPTRVLGCHHFIDEEAEMKGGEGYMICLVTPVVGGERLVPKSMSKSVPKALAATVCWWSCHTQLIDCICSH